MRRSFFIVLSLIGITSSVLAAITLYLIRRGEALSKMTDREFYGKEYDYLNNDWK